MNKAISIFLLIPLFAIVSCSLKADYGQPDVNVENLQKDFMKWWTYYNERIDFSSDFIAIDNSSNKISKEAFLQNLTTGKYIPLKLISKDTSKIYYQIYKLTETADNGIEDAIKNASIVEYEHYKMAGRKFSEFSFTDLNGRLYTNENTTGKIVVLKCWYINCVACVAEFPELNELVNQYKNRDDVVFVSLAFDKADALKEFLLKKPFSYATVSDQKSYLRDTLKVYIYPTHFVIDRNGDIIKVVNRAVSLKTILANALKNNRI